MTAASTLEARRRQLELRASRRFAWHYQQIEVDGQFRQFATASKPDQLLLDACAEQGKGNQQVEDPYWAAVWHAAIGLGDFLERSSICGKRVLELGAGTGRAGIAAAMKGAKVTITDGMSDPLLLAELSSLDLPLCSVRKLRWGEQRLRQRFPVILGSDVTYNRGLWPLLESAIQDHLEEEGCALLSDPKRIISDEFSSWIRNRGWEYQERSVPHSEDSNRFIRVMEIRSKTGT